MDSSVTSINPIRSAIYYPFPYVRNERWLKEQALFWDSLYRIVPADFVGVEYSGLDRPTRTEVALSDELDFVKDLKVRPNGELRLVGQRLEALVSNSPWFREQNQRDQREYFGWRTGGDVIDGDKSISASVARETVYQRSGAWRYFPGKVYMALLARALSANTRMPIATDDAEHDLVLKADDVVGVENESGSEEKAESYLRADAWASENQATALLYSVIMQHVGCANLKDLTPTRIAAFRRKHDEERREFVSAIEELARGLKSRTYGSDEELGQYLREAAERIDLRRRDLMTAMRGSGIEAVLKASALSAPLLAAGLTGASLPELGASVGAGLGMTAIFYGSRRARRTDMVKDVQATYLFLLTKDFNARRHLAKLGALR